MDSVGKSGYPGRGLGEFASLTVFISICGNEHQNLPLSNVVVLEMDGGYPRDEGER